MGDPGPGNANPFREGATQGRGPSNLQLRLLTAAVGLPGIIILTWAGGWPFAIAAGAIAFLAAAEFAHGWLLPSRPVFEAFRMAPQLLVVGGLVTLTHADERMPLAAAGMAALCAIAGYAGANLIGPRKPFRVYAWGLLYLGVLLPGLVLVRDVQDGRSWAFLGLLSTFATDTGAYAVGRLIGRHLLAPKISPKKTLEGAAGGYLVGAAAVLVLNQAFDTPAGMRTVLPFALALPLAAQTGDLFESWMKRRMGVKDASRLLPGHGGFLDRLDSVLFVMPVLYLFLRWRVL